MNQFEHLKGKTYHSREEFIEGANKDYLPKAKKRINKEQILLTITGKTKREYCGKGILLYLKQDIEQDIAKYCTGSKQAVINYLVRRGLNDLKEKGEFVLEQEDLA